MTDRLSSTKRRQQILKEAAKMAKRHGLYSPDFSVRKLASKAGISHAIIYRHFPGIKPLRTALIEESFKGDRELFDMAFICKDPVAQRLIKNDTKRTESL